jgi:hypothetical protein
MEPLKINMNKPRLQNMPGHDYLQTFTADLQCRQSPRFSAAMGLNAAQQFVHSATLAHVQARKIRKTFPVNMAQSVSGPHVTSSIQRIGWFVQLAMPVLTVIASALILLGGLHATMVLLAH